MSNNNYFTKTTFGHVRSRGETITVRTKRIGSPDQIVKIKGGNLELAILFNGGKDPNASLKYWQGWEQRLSSLESSLAEFLK